MKIFIFIMSLLFTSSSAYAFDESIKGFYGFNGDVGYNTEVKSSPNKMENEDTNGSDFGIGLKMGYRFFANLFLYGSVEYHEKTFGCYETPANDRVIYTQNFIDTSFTSRFLFKSPRSESFYFGFDTGIYYGLRIGAMTFDGNGTSGNLPNKIMHNDYGFLFGLLFLNLIGNDIGIDYGFKLKFGIPYIANGNGYKIYNRTLTLNIGIIKFF